MQKACTPDLRSALYTKCESDLPPLCVDLDGTLVHSDLLYESIVAMLRQRPLFLAMVPFWLYSGRAFLKAKLATLSSVDVASLPYNRVLLDWLHNEKVNGRRLILATAATQSLARAVSSHLGLFDQVLASSPEENLKGSAKLAAILERVGPRFGYVGDSHADRPIMDRSEQAIWVASSFAPNVRNIVPLAVLVAREIRVHQWVKNCLIFLPLMGAHELMRLDLLGTSALAFLAFSLTASSVYVLNDLVDLTADRSHPQKSQRPFASGALPLRVGLWLVPSLLACGLGLAFWTNFGLGLFVLSYVCVTTLYTFVLKRMVIYDVLTLALLYVSRLFAGQMAYHVRISTWLLSCCFFLFLSLALCKRASELVSRERVAGKEELSMVVGRRSYYACDLPVVLSLGLGSALLASLITVLYVESDNVRLLYTRPALLWLLCPLLLQWTARLWVLAQRGVIAEDPVLFSLKEPVTWITITLGCALIAGASL